MLIVTCMVRFAKLLTFPASQWIVLFAAALCVWAIFFPGILNNDAISQYGQAAVGEYTDWHPPLMAIVLSASLAVGGGIGLVTLIQSVAALFGIRFLLTRLIRQFATGIEIPQAPLAATAITILLLFPITPLIYWLVTFVKDVWLATLLIWTIGYLLWLKESESTMSQRAVMVHSILVAIFAGICGSVRHNGLVLLPVLGVLLTFCTVRRLKWLALPLLIGPIVAFFILNFGVNKIFAVEKSYVGDVILAGDLRQVLALYPSRASELPLTAAHMNVPIYAGNRETLLVWDESTSPVGCFSQQCERTNFNECMNFDLPRGASPNCYMKAGVRNQKLEAEYYAFAWNHSHELLHAKLVLFSYNYRFEAAMVTETFIYGVAENGFGLAPNEYLEGPRNQILRVGGGIQSRWYLNWFGGTHWLWPAVAISMLLFAFFGALRNRSRDQLFLALLLLLPIAYYSSYILATVYYEYRFMLPATLLVQLIGAAWLTTYVLRISGYGRERINTR